MTTLTPTRKPINQMMLRSLASIYTVRAEQGTRSLYSEWLLVALQNGGNVRDEKTYTYKPMIGHIEKLS